MFGRLGPVELLLILAVVLIIFGPKKLPEIGSAIGKAIQNFRSGFKKKEGDGGDKTLPDGGKPES
jgi:sec-independent protein translocase protein TatA